MNFFFFDRSRINRNCFPPSEVNVLREFEVIHCDFLKDIESQSQYAVHITQSDIDVEDFVIALFADKQIKVEARHTYTLSLAKILYAHLNETISPELLELNKPPKYSPLYWWWRSKFANNKFIPNGGEDEKIA